MALLISPPELVDLHDSGAPVRLLDVRWRLDRPQGRPDYLDGHLPGAVYVDLDHELARKGEPAEGRHPLPTREALQDSARRWGLRAGETVVVYDDVQSVAAARAWWLLTRCGVDDVRVLDGGLRAWIAADLPLETGDLQPPRGDITLTEPTGGIATIDQVAAWPRAGVLLDVRAPERYRGDIEPLDPVAGHVPGAVNLPTVVHLEAGRFRDPTAIRAAFAAAGVAEGARVAAYCGSGITAAHTALAGALAGIEVVVFPGSWSEWSNTRGRLIATGPTPQGNVGPA
ncbi:sulfurtransferase [Microbacterium sp. zg.B48]|uniref:sulfurtransferase n=1 Tax=unclassified Microbacterium TaxID=2609290 RepID=UPI00214AB7B9|nr:MULTISPECIES: sulfurtransferase [unclassified Microbacterium]MCR2762363.1 sulfurtransferase [Microbacterium sp. zg.B48]MCR2809631.1 sulfurtransferase [Microbacterium sp. zg.B185]WIM18045.1 sulfurtransferase [Microbacterium sp. zg-B185]